MRTPIHLVSHGIIHSSAMHKTMQVQIKSSSECSHPTSKQRKNVCDLSDVDAMQGGTAEDWKTTRLCFGGLFFCLKFSGFSQPVFTAAPGSCSCLRTLKPSMVLYLICLKVWHSVRSEMFFCSLCLIKECLLESLSSYSQLQIFVLFSFNFSHNQSVTVRGTAVPGMFFVFHPFLCSAKESNSQGFHVL